MMRTRFRPAVWLATGMVASLVGCATPPREDASAADGLAQVDALLRQADTGMAVQLAVQPSQVRIGEDVRLLVNAKGPGYLYVYQVNADTKRVVQVFPNAVDGANYSAGGTVALPRATWRITAGGPAGVGYFVAVVSPTAMDLNAVAVEVGQGRIPRPAQYGAAMGSLREVAP